jgi:molybdopterin converting factor subunit 1
MFFARLRELLGDPAIEVGDEECPDNVGELRALLRERLGGELANALADPNVFCAVNQRVVDEQHPLAASDEVAFFPPMTGG